MIDPLENFGTPQNIEGCPKRTIKPLQYVRNIEEGRGTSQGLARRPALPKGIQTTPIGHHDAASAMAMLVLSNSEVDDHLGVECEGEIAEEETFAGTCHAHVTDPVNVRGKETR